MEDKKGRTTQEKELSILLNFWIVVGKIENVCVCVYIEEVGFCLGFC